MICLRSIFLFLIILPQLQIYVLYLVCYLYIDYNNLLWEDSFLSLAKKFADLYSLSYYERGVYELKDELEKKGLTESKK